MNPLRIYVEVPVTLETLQMLREGTVGHELLLPETPLHSALAETQIDPQFQRADVAFGQPDLESISAAPDLKWIHVSSSGITRYDTPSFRASMDERGIALSNSASVYNEPCAVHLLSFMLAQARGLPSTLSMRPAGGTDPWHRLRGASGTLRGHSALLLGYGAIGKRLVELLRPFDMKLLGFRRKPRGDEGIPMIAESDLIRTLGEVDHVVNILPASAETQHFFSESRFSAIKPGATFYNIGRGATVNQDALLAALRSQQIGAAWLDVTDPEPLPDDHPLWLEPNCFITPHIAGGHSNEMENLVRHFLENLRRFVAKEPLVDRVM